MRFIFAAASSIIAAIAVLGSAHATDIRAAPSELTWGSRDISWQDNSNNETGFRLEKNIRGEWLTVTTYPAGTNSAPHPGIGFDPGCRIPLRMFALNDDGDSEPSELAIYNPVPTPPPSGCPFAFSLVFTNDTAQSADLLTLPQPFGYQSLELTRNAPGCPTPSIDRLESPTRYQVEWPIVCVDSGESIDLLGKGTGPQVFLIGQWSVTVPLSPSLTPTASATPAATPATPVVTPATFPVAGGTSGATSNITLAVMSGALLLLVAAVSFKGIR